MDTNKLKKFATEARNRLKAGIAAKIITLGFDKNGRVPDHMHPQLMQGGSLWNGRLETEGFYHQWQALYSRVQQKGIKEVYEEAAYTWFNRLVALRILQKNALIEPVLSYVDEARTPRIVDEARMGRMPQMQERQRQLLSELLDDDAKTTEQFAILVTAFCHENPILSRCFGAMSDYTELLLPNDILTEGGFIDMLNHTEFITDDDFRSPELIGWLYQFYISERKDEVFESFKKGKKAEAEDIPAATQIFTPNWIVKYMVQNTIGRIYIDNNPSAASEFKPKWKYLVEPSEPTPKDSIYRFKELTELLTGDLACGSGHILNECFDLLYDLYIYEGYSRREAIENIFNCNLRGVDLDTRAKQLATFALMLKACQKDASFADAHILPHVLSMPTSIPQEQVADRLQQFFRETPSRQQLTDLTAAFELMQDADSLGSIMKFDVAESTLLSIQQTLNYWQHEQFVPEDVEDILPAMELILTLTDKYAALVMNPPYMGGGNMNETLSKYVKKYYDISKADLATVFVDVLGNKVFEKGLYSFIIPPSWMFLPSFEKLRLRIINNHSIDSFLQLSNGAFGGDFGSTPCVIKAYKNKEACGIYFRIVEKTFQLIESEHLKALFLKAKSDKDFKFKFSDYDRSIDSVKYSADGNRIVFENISQDMFLKIPGSPLAYWLSDNVINCFNHKTIKEVSISDGQTKTGDNNRYLRFLWEISANDLGINQKWVKHPKGGAYRRWYGNIEWVVDWSPEARAFYRADRVARILPEYLWWKKGISWTLLTSGMQGYRDYQDDCIFNLAAPTLFFNNEEDRLYILGLLNTPLSVLLISIFNPTINNNIGDIQSIPLIKNNVDDIIVKVKDNIEISKSDWDSHETSWDFEANPLVALRNEKVAQGNLESSFRLSDFVEEFEAQWTERFMQLHQNEEELNRQFISIYGLQDELTPDVPLDEITILQQGEISIKREQSPSSLETMPSDEDIQQSQISIIDN